LHLMLKVSKQLHGVMSDVWTVLVQRVDFSQKNLA
jgi:hypothetical protein